MALFKFGKKNSPSDSTSDVMDAEITEIADKHGSSLRETSKTAVRNMGLRMTEVPCPCSARRQGRPPVIHKKQQ